jgi:hypothetical protein
MQAPVEMREVARDAVLVLTFRMSREGFLRLGTRHLLFGLICTWIVGIGRWWDDPAASLLQHTGVGSVVYIFVLALVLWLVVRPFRPPDWSYKNVLTFVSLTSPPALLYAIPVERFVDLSTARSINVWFLALVATWRVALLSFYFRRFARLTIIAVVVSALLPIMAIVATLTVLNLERAVFDIMGGLRESGTSNDAAYAVLFALTFLSLYLVIPVFVIFIVTVAYGGVRRDES